MGANQHTRPVTDEDRTKLRELHAAGQGRNAIARALRRSPRTISVLAEDMGLSFDRGPTSVATEARIADGRARRARILAGLYEVAEAELNYLRRSGAYNLVEVSSGQAVRFEAERLPAQDRRALITGISTAMTAASRLEAMEGDPGIAGAASLLMNLSDAFRLAAGPPEDDTGEG